MLHINRRLFGKGALAALSACFGLELISVNALAAPLKCAEVSAVSGPLGYQARNGGARCEGLYQQAVGSERIELLNLTAPVVIGNSAKFIQISVAASKANTDLASHIVGVSLVQDTFYRLDAPISPSQPVLIPISDVLEPAALDPSQLGFVGYGEGFIVPLHIQLFDTNNPKPATAAGAVSAIISLSTFAAEIRWRWKPTCRPNGTDESWNRLVGSSFFPRTPIAFDIAPLPAGPCSLMVTVKTTGDEWISNDWVVNAVGF